MSELTVGPPKRAMESTELQIPRSFSPHARLRTARNDNSRKRIGTPPINPDEFLEPKPILYLHRYFPRVRVMRAAEGIRQVDQIPVVCQIES